MAYEREKQQIGRYTVSLLGQECDVSMIDSVKHIARNLTAREAVIFLTWLEAHKEELYRAALNDEQSGGND